MDGRMKIAINNTLRIETPVSKPTYDAFRPMLNLHQSDFPVLHGLHPCPNLGVL